MSPYPRIIVLLAALFTSTFANAAANSTQVNVLAYATTNVTTAAYVQLVAASPVAVSKLQICDTSGQILKIAIGSVGNETDVFTTTVSGCVIVPIFIGTGVRFSIKAISASATTGFSVVSFVQ